jgi:hypothetical protein
LLPGALARMISAGALDALPAETVVICQYPGKSSKV